MAIEGHAPTRSSRGARELYLIGQGTCPKCESALDPTESGGVACHDCSFEFAIGGDRL